MGRPVSAAPAPPPLESSPLRAVLDFCSLRGVERAVSKSCGLDGRGPVSPMFILLYNVLIQSSLLPLTNDARFTRSDNSARYVVSIGEPGGESSVREIQ